MARPSLSEVLHHPSVGQENSEIQSLVWAEHKPKEQNQNLSSRLPRSSFSIQQRIELSRTFALGFRPFLVVSGRLLLCAAVSECKQLYPGRIPYRDPLRVVSTRVPRQFRRVHVTQFSIL
ncbi:hypothetical protein V2J09_015601 [Rumex salicifolius]